MHRSTPALPGGRGRARRGDARGTEGGGCVEGLRKVRAEPGTAAERNEVADGASAPEVRGLRAQGRLDVGAAGAGAPEGDLSRGRVACEHSLARRRTIRTAAGSHDLKLRDARVAPGAPCARAARGGWGRAACVAPGSGSPLALARSPGPAARTARAPVSRHRTPVPRRARARRTTSRSAVSREASSSRRYWAKRPGEQLGEHL